MKLYRSPAEPPEEPGKSDDAAKAAGVVLKQRCMINSQTVRFDFELACGVPRSVSISKLARHTRMYQSGCHELRGCVLSNLTLGLTM